VPSGTASDATATGRTARRTKPPLYWDGVASAFVKSAGGVPAEGPTYRTMRSVGFGAYITNRMWIPDGRDTVAVSDYLNANTYDPFWQSFRANQGSNDYIVAIHPWREGSVLIFMRNSIWLAEINQIASTDGSAFEINTPVTSLVLLSNEVGCVARRSIQTAGNFVYFLADNGVHRLDTQLDLKLQGNTLPLSDPIADQLENLNYELADGAVGGGAAHRSGRGGQERGHLGEAGGGGADGRGCERRGDEQEQGEQGAVHRGRDQAGRSVRPSFQVSELTRVVPGMRGTPRSLVSIRRIRMLPAVRPTSSASTRMPLRRPVGRSWWKNAKPTS
jgi:hypothetical protein